MKVNIAGKTIVSTRLLSPTEMEGNDWSEQQPPIAIALDDGSLLFPGTAPEGEHPALMIITPSINKDATDFEYDLLSPGRLVGQKIKWLSRLPSGVRKTLGWPESLVLCLTDFDVIVVSDEKLSAPGVFQQFTTGGEIITLSL